MAGTSGSFGEAGVEDAGAVAGDAGPLFARAFAAGALAGAPVFAGVLAGFRDFSDFAFGDGVTVFTLVLAGDALVLPFEAVATGDSA